MLVVDFLARWDALDLNMVFGDQLGVLSIFRLNNGSNVKFN